MKFSIITPSFRNSNWLKLCVASVADQRVELEHIIQDAGSDDGTLDWLLKDQRVRPYVERDEGMYDAINRGYKRATGEILAYLNCDEQYLPGALERVGVFFQEHPEVDVALTDSIVVDPQGQYLCHRYSLTPIAGHLWVRFSMLTCAVFFRRRVLDQWQAYFDPRWRALGDLFWYMELVRRGARFGELRHFTSVFTETGENLALKPVGLGERKLKQEMTPWHVRIAKPAIVLCHGWRLFQRGTYRQPPFEYALYTQENPAQRTRRSVTRPTGRWPAR